MKVSAILQSGNWEPVEQVWSRDTDEVGAIQSLAQLLQHAKSEEPWAPRIVSVTITL